MRTIISNHSKAQVLSKDSLTLSLEKKGKISFESHYFKNKIVVDALHAYTGETSILLVNDQVSSEMIPVKAGQEVVIQVFTHFQRQPKKALQLLGSSLAGGLVMNLPPLAGAQQEGSNSFQSRGLLPYVGLGIAVSPFLFSKKKRMPVKNQFSFPKSKTRLFTPDISLVTEIYNLEIIKLDQKIVTVDKSAKNAWQNLKAVIKPEQDGFIRISMGNKSNHKAWFDELSVSSGLVRVEKLKILEQKAKKDRQSTVMSLMDSLQQLGDSIGFKIPKDTLTNGANNADGDCDPFFDSPYIVGGDGTDSSPYVMAGITVSASAPPPPPLSGVEFLGSTPYGSDLYQYTDNGNAPPDANYPSH